MIQQNRYHRHLRKRAHARAWRARTGRARIRLGSLAVAALAVAALGCKGVLGGDVPAAADPDPAPDAASGPCEGGATPQTYYVDGDMDGYGDADQTRALCEAEPGVANNAADCDDGDPDVHPDAIDLCGDDIDNDCSGVDICRPALLAHWAFAEAEGTTAADSSGNGHTGTLRSGTSFLAAESAVRFDGSDGVNDYIEVPHAPAFLVDEGSVVLWFRIDAVLGTEQGLWSKDATGTDDGGHLGLRITPSGTLAMRLQDTVASYIIESPDPVTPGAWHHLVATFGPAGMRLYLDAALAANHPYGGGLGTSSGGPGNNEPIAFGSLTATSDEDAVTPTSRPLTGDIADIRMYSRALTSAEIADLLGQTSPIL